jgi:ABC-type polysaccharide/polyol phosphate transport system ATPase subunit
VNAIAVRNVRKTYRRYGRRKSFGTLKSAILSGRVASDLKADESFEALKGVSFDVPIGKTFGIVGRNGSGKSTMLKLIAGIGRPTSGEVQVHGRVSALIELGAGFHPEISGRDNVFINGMMLGLSKREIASRFDEIVAFAELEDFIDDPVKTYSSGMYMRLGFSVAINVDPDVLLVDEVLAVGDEASRQVRRFPPPRSHRAAGDAFARHGDPILRRSDLARPRCRTRARRPAACDRCLSHGCRCRGKQGTRKNHDSAGLCST